MPSPRARFVPNPGARSIQIGLAHLKAAVAAISPQFSTPDPQPTGVRGDWTLVFAEEFSRATLDSGRWTTNEGWTKKDVIVHAANVAVADGRGVLRLAGADSGVEMVTKRAWLQIGGFAEARIEAMAFENWLAFWTTGETWPRCGELDVLEAGQVAGKPGATCNYHCGPDGISRQLGPLALSTEAPTGFHIFGVHRLASQAVFYTDGEPVESVATDDNGDPHFLLLTMGLAAGAVGVYGADGEMRVDYVRCWQRA